jgi:hypothetical protein
VWKEEEGAGSGGGGGVGGEGRKGVEWVVGDMFAALLPEVRGEGRGDWKEGEGGVVS